MVVGVTLLVEWKKLVSSIKINTLSKGIRKYIQNYVLVPEIECKITVENVFFKNLMMISNLNDTIA